VPLNDRIWKLQQKATNYFYPFATRRLAARDVLFINYGYEEDPPMGLALDASDEHNRYCIQLYHRTASQVDLTGKRVLEVGSGHGGGASYLTRTARPASYTGLDLNPAAVAFCRKRHNVAGLDFVQGDAQDLPFADQSFDAVINVASGVHYPQFERFLAEVARVLVSGGHFLYCDARHRERIAAWETALAGAPLRIVSHTAINAELMRGMEKNSLIEQPLLRFLMFGLARKSAGVQKSQVYRSVQSGRSSFRIYCFVKD
jgi:ubiquinone/menaquinone biosynthesis C-methylase UbiE